MNPKMVVVAVALSGCGTGDYSKVVPGTYSDSFVEVKLLEDGRDAILLKDFKYVDHNKLEWIAPAGQRIDGATIPQLFWSLIGGPYEGRYRFAAVIHDSYCRDPRGRTWQSVHRVFYEAMVTSGTEERLAKIMYAAVYHYGPRWNQELDTIQENRLASLTDTRKRTANLDWQMKRAAIEANPSMSLEQIEKL